MFSTRPFYYMLPPVMNKRRPHKQPFSSKLLIDSAAWPAPEFVSISVCKNHRDRYNDICH